VSFRPIYTNAAFGLRFALRLKAGEVFTFVGKTIWLVLDCAASDLRVKLDSVVDATPFLITNGGLTLDIVKVASWTSATLVPGEWTFTLFVGGDSDRIMLATGPLRVVAPPRGTV
jgi:hypothetical protein